MFVGHASHQSARYRLRVGDRTERQSSSGMIVATGTGATGWAASIHRERHSTLAPAGPEEDALSFFVREPWPSRGDRHRRSTEGRLDGGRRARRSSPR